MNHNGDYSTTGGKPKPKLLSKDSSVVILQEALVQRSSFADSEETVSDAPKATVFDGSPQATVAVDISLRRGRIALVNIVVVTVIIGLVRFFHSGYEIRQYDKATLDATQQKGLLDQYNSYSGNIVSVFSKPIELFVAACVQVILLRFVSASLLRNEPSWKAVYGALALSACVGYLINNGFNALNAQLVDLEISSVIEASDLSLDDTAIAASSNWQSRTSNVSWSVPENQLFNPITNTVLRNLVLSRAARTKTVCETKVVRTPIPLDTVEYGFPQREWMKQLLTEAVPAGSLSFLLNPTNEAANNHLNSEDLPMNASIASNLVLYAVRMASDFTPVKGSLKDPMYNETSNENRLTYNISAAVRVGIMPPDPFASDAEQKKWLLKNVNAYLTTAFNENENENMTLTNVSLTFSHVDIAPNISFDAVSFEFEVNPDLLANATDPEADALYGDDESSKTLKRLVCDPWPARCMVKKRDPPVPSVLFHVAEQYYDAPAQIQVFSMCLNSNGTEVMGAVPGDSSLFDPKFSTVGYLNVQECDSTSNTSMLVLSVGKRLVADALTENKTVLANGESATFGSAENVRKIYTFTIGRLSWQLANIAEEFGAKCNVSGGESCQGLALTLKKTSRVSSSQRLVVSARALPMDALLPPQLNNINWRSALRQRPLTLVQVNEPTRLFQPDQYNQEHETIAGDILLPHNIRNLTWDESRTNPGSRCVYLEERVQRVLDNHMYIEHPLQAAYTAGLFYLLQNGLVKDVIANSQSRSSANTTLLAFNGNAQKVALVVSTPSTNAILTQFGCLILIIGVTASIIWATAVHNSPSRPDLLTGITNAEIIARAKLDEKSFSPLLLHRHVTNKTGLSIERRELDGFVVTSLSLQLRDMNQAAKVDPPTESDEDSSSVRLSVQI